MSSSQKRKLTNFETVEENKRQHISHEDMELKISKLISAVLTEEIGNLIILVQDENPYVALQNAISYSNMNFSVSRIDSDLEKFELHINGKLYASGNYQKMQIAKKELAEQALEKLKETCFFIYKKKSSVNVTKENLQLPTSSGENLAKPVGSGDSVAHKIMMKMGWTGAGLGAHEQGNLDSVALSENFNRQGFGTNNLGAELTKKFTEFSNSSHLQSLVFDEGFTKEERILIHVIARKFNLKSKSTGTEARRLTVSKKLTRMDIVKELLKVGGEDGLYKLHVPTKFLHHWQM